MDVQKHFKKTKGASALYGVFAALMVLCTTLAVTTPALAYHFPWDQGHDTFDWNDPNDPGPCEGPECDPCKSTGSPVYIPTGHFVWTEQDIQIPGRPGLSISRTYNSNDPKVGMFGNGWSSNCDSVAIKTVDWEKGSEGGTLSATTYLLREPNGKRYSYTLGENGQVEAPTGRDDQVELLSGGEIKLSAQSGSYRIYNASGQLLEDAAPSGESISYEYDDTGRLVRMAASSGAYLDFDYNPQGFVGSITDSASRQWQYFYDTDGNLVQVQDPTGGSWDYAYQPYSPPADAQTYHQLTRITDPDGVVVTDVAYNGTRVASYTSGENTYSYSYNVSQKTVVKTDSVGATWTFVYDEDAVITKVTAADNTSEQYVYDDDGNMVNYIDQAGNEWLSTFDEQGRRLSFTDPLGNTEQWSYGSDQLYPTTATSPTGRITNASYDDNGNIVSLTDPSEATTQFTWSERGFIQSVRNALGQQTTFETDASGLPISVTQPDGKTGQISYNTAGHIVSVSDNTGAAYVIERDALGRTLKTIEPSGRTLTYQRNGAGDLLALTDGKGQTTSYTYDEYGRLVSETLSDGRQRNYTYRTDNLLETVTEPDGSVVTFTYDNVKQLRSLSRNGETTTYDYNARGLLTEASNNVGVVKRSYDDAGRLVTEQVNGKVVTYTYNAENEVVSVSALGETRNYERDSRGLLTTMAAPEGQYDFGYDALSRRTSLSMPNGQSVSYSYNISGQPTSISHSGPYQNDLQYSYNTRGLMSNYSGKDVSWSYGYDPDGQLSSASSALATYNYEYDDAGNLIGGVQVYDAANRLLEDANFLYEYDQQGNLTAKTDKASGATTTYQWNAWDQLSKVDVYETGDAATAAQSTTYLYGPLGRRWAVTENGTRTDYVYDGLDRIAELDSSGNVIERVTFGPAVDEPFAITGDSSTNYLHANHIGSVIGISSSVGTLGEYRYSPFGQHLSSPEGELNNPFRYAGREYEGGGLYYNRARYYDSVSRRFISEDPLGTFPGNTNLYTYAQNNPVHGVDPSGQIVWFAIPVLYGAVEVGLSIYDAYDTVSTITDPCRTAGEKWAAGGLFALGVIAPGGGYSAADDIGRAVAKKAPDITTPYKRPSGATTKAQRESVQNQPCVDCGNIANKQVADHKTPLVKEYYETGTIDKTKMRSLDAVQPQCPTCSARQGAEMSRYSRQQKKDLGL